MQTRYHIHLSKERKEKVEVNIKELLRKLNNAKLLCTKINSVACCASKGNHSMNKNKRKKERKEKKKRNPNKTKQIITA